MYEVNIKAKDKTAFFRDCTLKRLSLYDLDEIEAFYNEDGRTLKSADFILNNLVEDVSDLSTMELASIVYDWCGLSTLRSKGSDYRLKHYFQTGDGVFSFTVNECHEIAMYTKEDFAIVSSLAYFIVIFGIDAFAIEEESICELAESNYSELESTLTIVKNATLKNGKIRISL